MTEREPKEIIKTLINEYKTYKKASFLIIPILAIAAAATFFNRGLSLVLLAAAVIYQIFESSQKNGFFKDNKMGILFIFNMLNFA